MNERAATPSLPMGGIAVARDNGRLRTLLGSCIGLVLYDRRLKIGGLAHVVLPKSLGRTELPGKYADTAVPAVIERMQSLADGENLRLAAKLAGGANMFAAVHAGNQIGAQNQAALELLLGELRIPIVGRHCGGEQGRRVTFDTATGMVCIEIAGEQPVDL